MAGLRLKNAGDNALTIITEDSVGAGHTPLHPITAARVRTKANAPFCGRSTCASAAQSGGPS
ncbi:hypothetical protein NOVOSPHI9U_370023 [Novosphingobium sp. 9U]|nr:hypothetical protein NOVOSPHI9U_370023 [Novosphingobium sp. 9U]